MPSWRDYNHNVVLCLFMWSLYSLSDSVWNGTVFASWLYVMAGDSNLEVGAIEAMQGTAMMLTAYPVGYLADKYLRSTVIAWGGFINLAALATLAFSVVDPYNLGKDVSFWILTVSMCLYGVGQGVVNGPAQALYADSIPTGDRSRWYLYLYVGGMLASVVGPLISVLGFIYWGNDWTLPELRKIILLGLLLEVPASMTLFFFNDKHALGEESEALNAADEDDTDTPPVERRICGVTVTTEWIPYILFAGDVITSLASGMTIKFFPLWMKNNLAMTPVQTQIVFTLSPLFIAGASWFTQRFTLVVGRVWSVILVNLFGVGCLLAMVYMEHHAAVWVTVLTYLLRTAAMNGSYPIQEAILMDYVPKERRSRWKALQSIANFGWCGSAFIGGWLADAHGYGYSFLITAVLQGAACVLWFPMLGIVAEEKLAVITDDDIAARETEPLVNWHIEDDGGRRLSVGSLHRVTPGDHHQSRP